MQGSIESPPIIVRSSGGKIAWQLIVCGCAGALGLFDWFWISNGPTLSAVFLAIVGVVGVLDSVRILVNPDVLELSPEGLRCKVSWRDRHFAWRETGNFRVETFYGKGLPLRTVVFNCNPDDAGKIYPVNLGNKWEIDNVTLASLLDRARAKWLRAT